VRAAAEATSSQQQLQDASGDFGQAVNVPVALDMGAGFKDWI
jgi:hypothetical protein